LAPRDGLVVASAKVTVAAALSRVTGFLRDVVLAGYFGATGLLDAYFVAVSVPGTVQLTVGSLLKTSFVAVYSRLLARGQREKAGRLSALILVLALAVAALAAILITVFAGPLVRLVAPGLPPADANLATAILRVLSPLAILGLAESWAAGVLNSHGVFGVPAAVGIPRNLILAAAVTLTAGAYGVWGLVGGALASFALGTLWLLAVVRRLAPFSRPRPAAEKPELEAIASLAWPIIVANVARRLEYFVDQILASFLGAGSISAIAFGSKLAQTPVGLLGTAVATVLYPALARRAGAPGGSDSATPPTAARAAHATGPVALFHLTQQGWIGGALVLAPFTGLLIALRVPIVDLIYGRGSFGWEAVTTTAWAMAFYAPAIVPWGWQPLTSRSFYALGDSRTPARVAVVAVAVNAISSIALAPLLGVGGIALGTTIGATFHAALLSVLLARKVGRAPEGRFWRSLGKIVVAAAVGAILAWGAVALLAMVLPTGRLRALGGARPDQLAELATVAIASTVCLAGYAATVLALRVPEAGLAWRALWSRFGRRPGR
jgi:putative peptidoglycan lipid II flippase